MSPKDSTETILESVIDLYLREFERDPKRSVRKLVDLGRQFSSGRFQEDFFELTHNMLEEKNSPYYDMAEKAVKKISHQTLKTFGINLGYHSCLKGAKTIRRYKEAGGRHSPWSLTFYLQGGEDPSTLPFLKSIIDAGKRHGIFTYSFLFQGNPSPLSLYFPLLSQEEDCAFLFFLPPGFLEETKFSEISRRHNLLLSLETGEKGWKKAAEKLEKQRCLYALHRNYSSREDVEEIVSGAWGRRIEKRCGVFAFCLASEECPADLSQRVEQYALKSRTQARYSFLPINFYSDSLMIDEIISGQAEFWGVDSKGVAVRYTRKDGREILPLASLPFPISS